MGLGTGNPGTLAFHLMSASPLSALRYGMHAGAEAPAPALGGDGAAFGQLPGEAGMDSQALPWRASCPSALGGTAGGAAAAGLDFGLQQLGLQAGEQHG